MEWFLKSLEALRDVILIFAAPLGLWFAHRRITTADKQAEIAGKQARTADQQAEIAMKNHLADAYTRAINQLGAEKEAIQLGGLYALEKIADSNESYYRQIIEVLCAFIRLTAGPAGAGPSEEKVELTVQTALTILGRRNLSFGELPQNRGVGIDLAGIKLCNAKFSEASFIGANLSRADLSRANLSGADFSGTWLSRARLYKADLSWTKLSGADLTGADISEADLSGTILFGTNLREANLREANLRETMMITVEQLRVARVYKSTKLPDHIDRQSLDLQGRLT